MGPRVKHTFMTEEQQNWLAKNASTKTVAEISAALNIPKNRIICYLYRHKIEYVKKLEHAHNDARRWTQEEINVIKGNAGQLPVSDIAKRLNRSEVSVTLKARRLHINLGLKSRRWSKKELLDLMTQIEMSSPRSISIPNRTYPAIAEKAYSLGYKPFCGSYSLSDMIRKTGYDRSQIIRAKTALNQLWMRVPWKGQYKFRFSISEPQFDDICEYLKNEGNSEAA